MKKLLWSSVAIAIVQLAVFWMVSEATDDYALATFLVFTVGAVVMAVAAFTDITASGANIPAIPASVVAIAFAVNSAPFWVLTIFYVISPLGFALVWLVKCQRRRGEA